jgi:hypothetical protein
VFSLGGIKSLGVLLGLVLLSGLWWHGYRQGVSRAHERCDTHIRQLREAFLTQEKQRAEQAAEALKALQQRFARQVEAAHQAEQDYLTHVERLNARTQQLTRQIDEVTHDVADEQGQTPTVCPCVLSHGFVQHYNAALGVPDATRSGAATPAGRADKTARAAAPTGEPRSDNAHGARGVSPRDILINITDNGQQCQRWRAQVNGLLDYIQGLTP